MIEGDVENCVLFRGVKDREGRKDQKQCPDAGYGGECRRTAGLRCHRQERDD